MSLLLFIEQTLNGLQFGVMLFLMAAGLTLVFGVMGLINLAHGSLYMVGAFAAAAVAAATGSFLLALVASFVCAAFAGILIEFFIIRRLYDRDHLDQVLATFALILIFSEGTRWVFGSFPLFLDTPEWLSGTVMLPFGIEYSLYRLAIILVGLIVAAGLFWMIARTRVGIRIRAGENDREMIAVLGREYIAFVHVRFCTWCGIGRACRGAYRCHPICAGWHGRACLDPCLCRGCYWRYRINQRRLCRRDPCWAD